MEQKERETPVAWRLMRSDVMKSFLTKFTPKFFATQGLSSSVYDQNLQPQSSPINFMNSR